MADASPADVDCASPTDPEAKSGNSSCRTFILWACLLQYREPASVFELLTHAHKLSSSDRCVTTT